MSAQKPYKLSENFTLEEMTFSQTAARHGIANTPPTAAVVALNDLCRNVLEPVRAQFGPVRISSGYRSPALNVRIGGSSSSQHCKGEAVDFTVPGHTVEEIFNWIRKSDLPFDQVIFEFGQWIHVSHTAKRRNRRQALIGSHKASKTIYSEVK